MPRRFLVILLASLVMLLSLAAIGCGGNAPAPDATTPPDDTEIKLLVLAASDLRTALEVIVPRYEEVTGVQIEVSYGSTGQLARQIENGGKADVFLAASKPPVDDLVRKKLADKETERVYAFGRLAVWSKDKEGPADIAALKDERYKKIAIANPEHAPYGIASEQALRKAGIHDDVEKRLVLAENASQAMQFARSGNAEAGIVPLSLAKGEKGGSSVTVPADMHEPIEQTMVVLTSATYQEVARRFTDFLAGPDGRAELDKWGFGLPELEPALQPGQGGAIPGEPPTSEPAQTPSPQTPSH